MMSKVIWDIIGTGSIAQTYMHLIQRSNFSLISNILTKSKKNSERIFCLKKNYNLKDNNIFFDDKEFISASRANLVYIATTNNLHDYYATICINNNKNTLVEKPADISSLNFTKNLLLAKKNKLIFLDALMYLHHPQTKKILDLLRQKEIGNVYKIKFDIGYDLRKKFFITIFKKKINLFKKKIDFFSSKTDPKLGGGAINDLACYPLSYSMLIAGVNFGEYFIKPTKIKYSSRFTSTMVDESCDFRLNFKENIIADLSVSINKKKKGILKIYGDKGILLVPKPILPEQNFSFFIKKNFFFKEYKSFERHNVYQHQIKFLEDLILKKKISKLDNLNNLTIAYIEQLENLKLRI